MCSGPELRRQVRRRGGLLTHIVDRWQMQELVQDDGRTVVILHLHDDGACELRTDRHLEELPIMSDRRQLLVGFIAVMAGLTVAAVSAKIE